MTRKARYGLTLWMHSNLVFRSAVGPNAAGPRRGARRARGGPCSGAKGADVFAPLRARARATLRAATANAHLGMAAGGHL